MAVLSIANGEALSSVRGKMNQQFAAGIPFSVVAKLTSAAAATPVHVVAAAVVGAAQAIYIDTVLANVNGGTAWTDVTATVVKLVDTAGSPVTGVTIGKAALLGNAVLNLASTGVTSANLLLRNTGFTVAKGLDLVADANFAAGSDLYVKVSGFIY